MTAKAGLCALKVLFAGTVQGVGFRFTTRRLAADFPVTGYVKNLANGKVEVWAEGPADEIDRFVHSIESSFSGYIRNVDRVRVAPTGAYVAFNVAF